MDRCESGNSCPLRDSWQVRILQLFPPPQKTTNNGARWAPLFDCALEAPLITDGLRLGLEEDPR